MSRRGGGSMPPWPNYGSGSTDTTDDESSDDDLQPIYGVYPEKVTFEVASWHTEPWRKWPEDARKAWMPYLESFLAARSAEMMMSANKSPASGLGLGPLYRRIERPNTVRILELLQASSQTVLHGKLHEVDIEFTWPEDSGLTEHRSQVPVTDFAISLESAFPVCYTALSYTWGPPQFDKIIKIDGIEKRITTALHDALVHLRHDGHSVLLWVDQICIDQSDRADKESQIQLMGKIYNRAWNTAIWVPTESARGAYKTLKLLDRMIRFGSDDRMIDWRIGDLLNSEACMNVKELLSQPWFKRTWTIQEACLSHRPFLVTGRTAKDWIEFSRWCQRALQVISTARERASGPGQQTSEEGLPVAGLETVSQLSVVRENQVTGSDSHLLKTLIKTRYAQVTNPLDKVYGILGLCESRIKPDYSKTTASLFFDVAVEAVERAMEDPTSTNYCFRLLCCVDHEPTEGLPSWAVDWAKPRVTTSLGPEPDLDYDAGGSLAARQTNRKTFSLHSDRRMLKLSAIVFGTVQHLSEVFTSAELSAEDCRIRNRSLTSAIAFANSRAAPFSLLCETMIAGKHNFENGRRPGVFTEIFSQLCEATTGTRPSVPEVYSWRQQQSQVTAEDRIRYADPRGLRSLKRAYKSAMLQRRLCWSDRGHLGLVPRHTREGDLLCVVLGSVVPFVVRRRTDGCYTLVGECYVRDVMAGQLLRDGRTPVMEMTLR